MKRIPKVSVILTSYNHAHFISESIESVLNQTYTDFELIIWDDHSADNSWEIISNYDDSRIRAFRNDRNQGDGNIRKAVKEVALGEYIAIHHSDDIWEQTKLEKQVRILEHNSRYAAVFSHAKIINESGKLFSDQRHFYYRIFDQSNRTKYEWLRFFFLHSNALCNSSVLIRKHCYESLTPYKGLHQLPDLSLWVQLCFQYEIFIVQEKLIRFRVRKNENNWSGDRPGPRKRTRYELLKIFEYYKNVSSMNELLLIFPEADKYVNENNADILYALGMIAIALGTNAQHKLFGLNILWNALNDPERAKKLHDYQHFGRREFITLSGNYDIFSIEERLELYQSLHKKNEEIADRDLTIRQMDKELSECKQEVLNYTHSKSWRITKPLRKIMRIIRKILK